MSGMGYKAIVSEELWDKVPLMISQKKGKPSRIYDGEYPLTGILKCPECGAGMVISRVVNKRKDGSKHKLTCYACGNWKNKGTAVCHSNMVRVEQVNAIVYQKLEQILTNDTFFHEVVNRVNREHEIIKANAKKEKMIQTKETEKIQNRQTKNFESYEDGLTSKEEFLEWKAELNKQLEQIKESRMETAMTLITEESSNIDRTIRKRLLHMLISEAAIDKDRNIDSIKLKLTDELIRFLQNNGGTPPDGVPSVFLFRELGIKTLELELIL